jgi:GT2 family glycosyltransferase
MSNHAHWVAVIVVNWNGLRHLETCLSSLVSQTYPHFEVVMVDNGSTDGSADFVHSRFPSVRIIQNEENVGFAAGNNVGIRQTDSEFVAMLNNDAWVEPNWLEELAYTMTSDSRVGMCASKMLFAHCPTMINSAGICLDRLGIAWDRCGGLPDDDDLAIREIFGPCAGAAMYRRELFEDVGGFDEDFFAFLEDVDLAWRARWREWRCLYVPAARAYHAHSSTAGEGSPLKRHLLGRNKVWTLVKNYPWPHLALYGPLICLYDFLSSIYALRSTNGIHSLRGRLSALRGMARMWSKRRDIQRTRNASIEEVMDLLWQVEAPGKIHARYAHLQRRDRSPR